MSDRDKYDNIKKRTINLWKECERVIPEFDENGNLPLLGSFLRMGGV